MDLSIIIAHYDPGNDQICSEAFRKTLEKIAEQKAGFNIEIIIADDGSLQNSNIPDITQNNIDSDSRTVYNLKNEQLDEWLITQNIDNPTIKYWLYLPKEKKCMSKARLWNIAADLAESENLLFLDDDNKFVSENSIFKCLELLQKYDLVFGQIQDANGHWRSYSSRRVQGTTFAITKNILKSVGGFGEWTEFVSSGIDSDLWWKLFHHFWNNPNLKACYTSAIQTRDVCSKRWKPFIRQIFRHKAVAKEFAKQHGCVNYRSVKHNPSRNKSLWIEDLT